MLCVALRTHRLAGADQGILCGLLALPAGSAAAGLGQASKLIVGDALQRWTEGGQEGGRVCATHIAEVAAPCVCNQPQLSICPLLLPSCKCQSCQTALGREVACLAHTAGCCSSCRQTRRLHSGEHSCGQEDSTGMRRSSAISSRRQGRGCWGSGLHVAVWPCPTQPAGGRQEAELLCSRAGPGPLAGSAHEVAAAVVRGGAAATKQVVLYTLRTRGAYGT